jgi:hypothetical protein
MEFFDKWEILIYRNFIDSLYNCLLYNEIPGKIMELYKSGIRKEPAVETGGVFLRDSVLCIRCE